MGTIIYFDTYSERNSLERIIIETMTYSETHSEKKKKKKKKKSIVRSIMEYKLFFDTHSKKKPNLVIKIAVLSLMRPPLFQTPDSAIFISFFFLSVKMQNKKKSEAPILSEIQCTYIFIKLQARPCSFLEKNRKLKKVSPTYRPKVF